MRNVLSTVLLILFSVFVARAENTPLVNQAYGATALLYSQSEDGGMHMRCTATAFEHDKDGYYFASAAHCVATDDVQHERVEVEKVSFFVTFDESTDKKFYPAKVVAVGYQHRGDDFSVLRVETKDSWPIVPLGDETKERVGAAIINVASPQGLGRQVFHGWITMLRVDRPIIEGDINWRGAILLQVESGPGSSGSAIVSVEQEAIVAFLVGHADQNIFAVPVSKMKEFYEAVKAKKYKWYVPDA
jgi:S1-C subfamily serine protease